MVIRHARVRLAAPSPVGGSGAGWVVGFPTSTVTRLLEPEITIDYPCANRRLADKLSRREPHDLLAHVCQPIGEFRPHTGLAGT